MPVLHRAPLRRYVVAEPLATGRIMPVFRIFALCIAVLCGFVIGYFFSAVALPIKVEPRTTGDPVTQLFSVYGFNYQQTDVQIRALPTVPPGPGHYSLKVVLQDGQLMPVSYVTLLRSAATPEFEIQPVGGFFISSGFSIAISVFAGLLIYMLAMGVFYYWRDEVGQTIEGARAYCE